MCALDGARLLFWPGQCLELPFMLPRLGEEEEECCSWRGQLPENAGRASSHNVKERIEIQLKHLAAQEKHLKISRWKLMGDCFCFNQNLLWGFCKKQCYIRRFNTDECFPLKHNSVERWDQDREAKYAAVGKEGGVLSDTPLTSLAQPVADSTPLSVKVLQFLRFGEEDERAGEAVGSVWGPENGPTSQVCLIWGWTFTWTESEESENKLQ